VSSRLIQLQTVGGERYVAVAKSGGSARRINGSTTTYALAQAAIQKRTSLAALIEAAGYGADVDLKAALDARLILPPIDHEDLAREWLTGTGLTHLGSADARDRMHAKANAADASDSMKMFRMGLEGGKPPGQQVGVQPEWFYKGDGRSVVAPEHPLDSPEFALDGGEEPELAGIYLIGPDGTAHRLGFALANEFSDHVMERMNYLYLAHSKLRPAGLGPELLMGELPDDIRGTARVRRNGVSIWEKPFLSGVANMSHHLRNLEHHHFKYPLFRRPGDVHIHFFGTATLSFADGIKAQDGDVFEVEAAPFTLPLRNALRTIRSAPPMVQVL
jgi:hypothetical protein